MTCNEHTHLALHDLQCAYASRSYYHSMSLCVSLFLSRHVSMRLALSITVCRYVSVYASRSVYHCMSLCHCVRVSLSVLKALSLFLSPTLSLLFLSLSLSQLDHSLHLPLPPPDSPPSIIRCKSFGLAPPLLPSRNIFSTRPPPASSISLPPHLLFPEGGGGSVQELRSVPDYAFNATGPGRPYKSTLKDGAQHVETTSQRRLTGTMRPRHDRLACWYAQHWLRNSMPWHLEKT